MSITIINWLFQPLLDEIELLRKEFHMDMKALAAQLTAIHDQDVKAKTEIIAAVGKLTDHVAQLEAELAKGGQTTPEVDAALALVKGDAQELDDLNQDAPPAETPAAETPTP